MKKECGSPITKPPKKLLTQRQWRTTGVITLAVCALMAWHGTSGSVDAWAPRAIFIYWGLFLLFLLVTLYLALLDLRYTWLEFKLGERSLYQDTLGEESFREAIKKARDQADRDRDG